MAKPITIVTIDDHALIREAIKGMIATREDMLLVGEGWAGEQLFALVEEHQPDVLILDLNMPQSANKENTKYETFLTELYVMVDDFCKSHCSPDVKPGPRASLSRSEIVTLAIVGQWYWHGSERGFYSYRKRHLMAAFPGLPTREQLNRLMRHNQAAITAFALFLAEEVGRDVAYEALDASAVPTRDINRRGHGWLPGIANYGKSNRLGYYEGVHLLISVTPIGAITGFGFGPADLCRFCWTHRS